MADNLIPMGVVPMEKAAPYLGGELELHEQPLFFQFSAEYMRDNLNWVARAGMPDATVTPICIHFKGAHPGFMLALHVQSAVASMQLLAVKQLVDAVLPRHVRAQLDAEELAQSAWRQGFRLVPMAVDYGWDLRGSCLGLLADFDPEVRVLMTRNRLDITVQDLPYAAGREVFHRWCDECVDRKRAGGMTIIQRNHDRLHAFFPEQLHLLQISCGGTPTALAACTLEGTEASLAELVGDATFRKDHVMPAVHFALLRHLKDRGVHRLHASRFEWWMPPVAGAVMRQDTQQQQARKQWERFWQGMHQRGMRDLPS